MRTDGGDDASTALSCSGGRRSDACFSARLMWWPAGAGELYTYLPDPANTTLAANAQICDIPPQSECNAEYGASIARGAFTFLTNQWTTVSQRVKLNSVDSAGAPQADGELELFVEGKSVISVEGIILQDPDKGRMQGLMMRTFFFSTVRLWTRRFTLLISWWPYLSTLSWPSTHVPCILSGMNALASAIARDKFILQRSF